MHFSSMRHEPPVDKAVTLRNQGIDVEAEYQREIQDIIHTADEKKKRRQSLVGIVVSTKCAKSITVEVYRDKLITKYNKVFRVKKKFMVT